MTDGVEICIKKIFLLTCRRKKIKIQDDKLKTLAEVAANLFLPLMFNGKKGEGIMPQIIDNRYQIFSEIGQGSMSTVYKALDTETNQSVAVKMLAESTKERKLESILRFRREATTMAKLSHPNIVQLHAVGEYDGTNYLVMELLEGRTLKSWLAQEKLPIDTTNHIIAQLASALDYAHQRHIVHRDVKPSNVMLVSECENSFPLNKGGQGVVAETEGRDIDEAAKTEFSHSDCSLTVKLMDFGLARLIDLRDFVDSDAIIGTVAYMAPEQTGILKRPVDFRADLYALGITWYEMLTGQLPFVGTDFGEIIHQHIAKTPTPPRQLNPGIPEPIELMALKLLAKAPEARYQTAKGLLNDLTEYQRLASEGMPFVSGFRVAQADRRSELTFQTRLIGREEELNRLSLALDDATVGKGSLFLIGGESGSGKTRLVDELREYAHISSGKGATFLAGKCYEYATNIAYNPFVEAIEEYVEQVKRLSEAEREAAVSRMKDALGILGAELTRVVPSLESLIGEQPPSVELEPDRQRFRFFNVVSDFLCSIATEERPLALFLDDLQWGDDGTLRLMQHLTNRIADAHVLLIGAYRREEVGEEHLLTRVIAELQEQNRPLKQLTLQTLAPADVREMVDEILGAKEVSPSPGLSRQGRGEYIEDASRSTALTQLHGHILAQTQGNPFFVSEMVKTLVESNVLTADASGWNIQLDRLGDVPLTASVADIVLKRLNALTHRGMEALSIASAIGKQFEFDLLLKLCSGRAQSRPYSSDETLDILDEGVQFQLIRAQFGMSNVYSFTHDRIIEALYHRLTPDMRTQLHGQIGVALEAPLTEPAGALIYELAHHFGQSADKAKALDYSIRAGDLAKATFAHAEAIGFYERALNLMPPEMLPSSINLPLFQRGPGVREWIQVVENLADVYSLSGNFDKAVANYEKLLPHFQGFDLLRIEMKIAYCFHTVFKFDESLVHYEKALAAIGKKTPRTSIGWTASLLAQLGIQIGHSLFPFLLRKYPKAQALTKIYMSIGWMYAVSDMKKMMCYMFKGINEADHAYDSVERVFAHSTFCLAYAAYGLKKLYQKKAKQVLAVVKRMDNPVATATYEMHTGASDYYCVDYESSIQHSLKATEMYRRIGDTFNVDVSCFFLGFPYFAKGDLEDTLKSLKLGMEQTGGLKEKYLAAIGWIYGYQGRLDEGMELTQQSLPSVESGQVPTWLLRNCRELGELHAMKGEWEEAIRWLEKSLQVSQETHALPRYCCLTYTSLAEALLGDRDKIEQMRSKEKQAHFKKVDKLCKQGIRAGADIVRGQAYRVEGRRWRLAGNPKKAMGYFQKSIEVLTRKGMRLQLALTYYEAGKWMLEDGTPPLSPPSTGEKEAQEYLEKAAELFEEIGAMLYLKRTQELLGIPSPEGEGEYDDDSQRLTERREREALMQVAQQMSSIRDLDELLNRILDEIMRVMGAERGFVMLRLKSPPLVKGGRGDFAPSSDSEEEGELVVKVARNINREMIAGEEFQFSRSVLAEVERTGEPQVITDAQADERFAVQASVVSYDLRSILCAPLKAEEELIGLIYIDNHLVSNLFTARDLELMMAFANQVASAVENASLRQQEAERQRLEQEMAAAREMQLSLLPKSASEIEGFDIAGVCEPATEVGGDYFNYLWLDEAHSKLGIVLMDVTGHGMKAAMNTFLANGMLQSEIRSGTSPEQIMAKMNQSLCAMLPKGTFVAMSFSVIDTKGKTLTHFNAGIPEPVIIRNGELVEPETPGAFPLGCWAETEYTGAGIELQSADLLVFHSDGIVEATNEAGEMYVDERFAAFLTTLDVQTKSAQEIRDAILTDVRAFLSDEEENDDMTVVVVKVI
jgi:serine/threonine protein kinase/serine phosphatase RsbU (regulator of sigma subunit)/tetratricopeptide (TPR) repeat protein